ncbi:hypothetical protein [Patulibacter minatonensis]|uniref:hypothetical protein n=1 Tax=Patulibacter minatonensis TaxID=298163 RepID=UPI00047CF76D|nr:hypothetical protein [Patulibacter minatonensis]
MRPRSSAASRARAARGPALLAPPLVVGSVDGGELDLRMRLRFGRRIPIGHTTSGLDRGGHLGHTRGRVVLAGFRPASGAALHRLAAFDVGDDHGFTPNGRSPLDGWCYGTEVLLRLRGVPEARSLAALPSGAPRTVRVAVMAKGGGMTTYDVPNYNDRDRRTSRAARATGCDAPYVSGP